MNYWHNKDLSIMLPPKVTESTKKERILYIEEEWKCLNHCESYGKCHVLKNHDALTLYADYVEGKREYMVITLEIRRC